jgi:hypothetical protein
MAAFVSLKVPTMLNPLTLLKPSLPLIQPPRRKRVATEEAVCCGWFDSSHELTCGLQVKELDGVQAKAAGYNRHHAHLN